MRVAALVAALQITVASVAGAAQQAEILRALAPLSVRGVNYYPQQTPWGGMWTATPAGVWEQDMARVAALQANAIRTFVSLGREQAQAGLLLADGAPAEAYLAKIETLLAAAWPAWSARMRRTGAC